MSQSFIHKIKSLPKEERKKVLDKFKPEELNVLLTSGDFLLRPEQMIPEELLNGSKRNWLIISGRGWGKNFAASHNLVKLIKEYGYKNIIYVGRTARDVRDIIVNGPSGIMNNLTSGMQAEYRGHESKIVFPQFNAEVKLRSGETPDSLRGPNSDAIIFDELSSYQYPDETFDNGQFGLRLNSEKKYPPICIITTTPKPIDLIKNLIKDDNTLITTGKTYDNPDLSADYISYLKEKYEGTTLGRQELYGELLENIEGALWNRELIVYKKADNYERIVIAIDPAVTNNEKSDLTGIVVVGKINNEYHVLEDASGRYSPIEWANKVKYLYDLYDADRVIGEVNQGGDLIESNLRIVDSNMSYKSVRAYKGKYLRAEPISSLYEQGKVFHTERMVELEDEMTTWVPGMKSPDRLDALVYAITELHKVENKVPKGFAKPTSIF